MLTRRLVRRARLTVGVVLLLGAGGALWRVLAVAPAAGTDPREPRPAAVEDVRDLPRPGVQFHLIPRAESSSPLAPAPAIP
jgi:hypothetical protein